METVIVLLKKGIPYMVDSNDSKGEMPPAGPVSRDEGVAGLLLVKGWNLFYLERRPLIKSFG
jgi:hypothetical protein